MISRLQVVVRVMTFRQQLMQYIILIFHQLAEQRIIGVADQFSHRQLIGRTETRTYSSADDCLKTISIDCRAKAIQSTGNCNRLEYNLQRCVHPAVIQRKVD